VRLDPGAGAAEGGERPVSPIVTLSTDLGDAYGAQMKAVLYRRLPAGSVVDLTHALPAHQVPESAFLLLHMARRFPAGTVHVAVVDPGVGSSRAPLGIATADGSFLVGPDNGLMWPLAVALGKPRGFRLDPHRVVPREPVAATFEGRDLFAPAAALLASGSSLEFLGSPASPVRYDLPEARIGPNRADGVVLHIDRFGNVITNVPTAVGPESDVAVLVRVGPGPVRRAVRQRTYADLPSSRLGLLGSSFGYLEIARSGRSAAGALSARVGARVRLAWTK
jgi:S-adenosylmethionine hydrolase